MEFKLIIKKLNNTLSLSEKEIFDTWYQEKSAHQNYFKKVEENYFNNTVDVDVEKGWEQISKKIEVTKSKIGYWKYAAAVLILITSGYFIWDSSFSKQTNTPTIVNTTIEAGTDKATLTLGDGTSITLEKGKQFASGNLESNGEELIYKKQDESKTEIIYNYLTIPRGGQYHLKLSDGTEVWLNSESRLKYPVHFIDGVPRKVELVYGEAYFDVSPSTLHKGAKFMVNTKQQEVEVFGTKFNIKAYQDETAIYTTLVEGKVSVFNGTNKKILKPAEQSVLNDANKDILITKVNVYDEISWRDGVFSFKDKPLKEIMKVLSRWYDVEIKFNNKKLENEEFFGVLKKNQNISDILLTLKNTKFIKNYEINMNTKTITID